MHFDIKVGKEELTQVEQPHIDITATDGKRN